jgi:hypothetical protein
MLLGGHDRAEGGSTREGSHGCTLPQCKSGSLAGGGAGAERVATAEGSQSWQGTCYGRGALGSPRYYTSRDVRGDAADLLGDTAS